jgi:hypothetical protein
MQCHSPQSKTEKPGTFAPGCGRLLQNIYAAKAFMKVEPVEVSTA